MEGILRINNQLIVCTFVAQHINSINIESWFRVSKEIKVDFYKNIKVYLLSNKQFDVWLWKESETYICIFLFNVINSNSL